MRLKILETFVAPFDWEGADDNFGKAFNRPLSFTAVYYGYPVFWILTEWLEPLRLTPPC
jgi:hypothetical protein